MDLREPEDPIRRPHWAGSGWPAGCRAALSFSFDDARRSQLRCGLSALDRLGIPATFFVIPETVASTVTGWRRAVAAGHEIGNHTLTHPCSANFPWSRGNCLERMTVADFKSEVSEANRRLRHLLGVAPTVFAYPCGHTSVGRGANTHSLVPLIAEMFEAGRTFNDVVGNSPLYFDSAQVACVNSDGQTFAGLVRTLDAVLADGAWLVLGGHEIDLGVGTDGETTQVETIEAVVGWAQSNHVWIDTIGNVSRAATMLQAGAGTGDSLGALPGRGHDSQDGP